MGRSTVDLVGYSPEWEVEFRRERQRLAAIFGSSAQSIEHIGSTAVPGLVAKPTIDVAVGLDDITVLFGKVPDLEASGYEFRPEAKFHDQHWFLRRIVGDERTHHLHVIQLPHPDWDEWLSFRDYLRASQEAAHRYASEKMRLADLFYAERGKYVHAKTAIVRELLAEATTDR
jgi:GrpB-like predicted nucleotidyltransferase (UPF0157 family)